MNDADDHVKPPGTGSAPPPDQHKACRSTDTAFQFDRLGSRLPVVLVSPWVAKGTVIHEPIDPDTGRREPTPTSQYDGTSIIASIKNIFQLPNFLTKRDAWSGSFHSWLGRGLTAPRTDTPMHLPDAPEPVAARKRREREERRRRRLEAGEDPDDDDDDDEEGDAECDDPSRRMRRSIRAFEMINNVTAPPRLHACAHAEPYWLNTCGGGGLMQEGTDWLAEQTENWRRRR